LRYFFLIVFLLVINIKHSAQNVDEKYLEAIKYISDSIDIYKEFKSKFPNKNIKEKKKNYTGFLVSQEINYIHPRLLIKKLREDTCCKIDSKSADYMLSDSFYFEKYKVEQLNTLTTNVQSLLYLYFSKPYNNLLVAEILPCKSLVWRKYCQKRRFVKRKKLKILIPLDNSYSENIRLNNGLRILFLYNSDGKIKKHIIIKPHYD
jgi:hypothetical protein